MKISSRLTFISIAAVLTLAVTSGVLTAARSQKWWWDHGGGPSGSHFVDLDQVNKSNVKQLEVAWFYPHGNIGFNPIVVDDMMFVSGRSNSLIALDPTTGKELWIHENLQLSARGINYWQSEDGREKRLLLATGPFLQAIDAKTGKSIMTFGSNGFVDLRDGMLRGENGIRVPNPGKVWKNLLILGNAPGEGWMSPPGDIRAFDVITGKLAWQFHTIPRPGEFGYETWPKDAWKYVGGANTWGELTVDDERGIVYLPTGSGTYDFYGGDRHGANLFANCLLALDAKTGKRLWHFQNIHHDLWDWDNVSAPQLATIRKDGRNIDIVAMAGKTGFLYVFNRVTGAPIWPIEERPVPQTDIPGEQSWPTQPFPTVVPPFGRQTFTIDDINPWLLTKEQLADWKQRFPKMRNEGLFTPPALRETVSMPGNQGGSNWGTTAANPSKGIVYVLNIDAVAILKLDDVHSKVGGVQMGPSEVDGRAAYVQFCAECHGEDPRKPIDDAANVIEATQRLSEDVIAATVMNGYNSMRPVPSINNIELTAILGYLATQSGGGRGGGFGRGGGPAGAFPAGPVVAAGGAPTPPQPGRGAAPPAGARYPGNGANGGNAAYPPDVDVPPTRYVSEWGVMANATKPPYATLTAYDLNKGTIKWQLPVGDDPTTIANGGPTNTGSPMLRNGIMPTKAGLVFMAGNDGKMRAYDEETGAVVWTGTLPGPSRGVPVIYEAKGTQYIVVAAQPSGGGRGATAAAAADTPRGYIAFALHKK